MTTAAELTARIEALEAENAALRGPSESPSHRNVWGRGLLSVLAISLGLILGTLSIVTTHVKTQLTNTDLFVSTFAVLPEEPAVQTAIIDATTKAFTDAVDLPGLTKDLFDGIRSLGLPEEAKAALGLLEGPAAQGAESLVHTAVTEVVTSPTFAQVWQQALRMTHTQIVATLSGEGDGAVSIGATGTLEIRLGPVIESVRDKLIAEGVGLAQLIPHTNYSIVLVQDEAITQLSTLYSLFTTLATWLPWVALALLTTGVALARRRRRALKITAVSAAVLMVTLGSLLAAGRGIVSTQLAKPQESLSAEAIAVFYDHATEAAGHRILAIGAIAVALLLVLWATGASRLAAVIRHGVVASSARLRAKLGTPSRAALAWGTWIDRNHSFVLGVIAVAAAATILLTRPLSVTTVVLTALGALVIVTAVQFVRIPAAAQAD